MNEMLNCGYRFEMSEISYIIWFNGLFLLNLHILENDYLFLIYNGAFKERYTIAKLNKHMFRLYNIKLGYINDWEKKKEILTMKKISISKLFSPFSASSNQNAWICIGIC